MKIFYKIAIVFIIYALLAIPDPRNPLPIYDVEDASAATEWWGKYAQNLVKFRIISASSRANQYEIQRSLLINLLDQMELQLTEPDSPLLDSISYHINKLSALASLVPNKINEFEIDISRWRMLLKYQSRYWDTSSRITSDKLYQLMVESRLAFESALVQSNHSSVSWSAKPSSSEFESVSINNVIFQSGDIITFNLKQEKSICQLIMRDLPNAYKHLGSVYVQNSVAHITYLEHETGLHTVPLEHFVNDLAPNGVVLRLREDIPAMIKNPQLPMLTASAIRKMTNERRYQFDYRFDLDTKNFLFDWELINYVFNDYDVTLGAQDISIYNHRINVGSDQVRIEPFALEYDPQLMVVGEWYNTNSLYEKRILTAATSSLVLSSHKLDFINPFLLPFYRLAKAYSMVLSAIGSSGPIPQGVSAQTQLVTNTLEKERNKAVELLKGKLNKYENEQKHRATYLKMLLSAQEINNEQFADL